MRRLFVDTTVLAYAAGDEHPLRGSCRTIVDAVAQGAVQMHASTEAIQELVFHRMRHVDRAVAVEQARTAAELCILQPVDRNVVGMMLDLIETTSLRGRDAVHAACALKAGFTGIVSADEDFDGVPGLDRVDPADLADLGPPGQPSR